MVPDGTIKIEDETSPAATYYTVHYFDILEVQTFAPPLADAGGPYVIDEGIEAQGGSITLDGTGSISNSPIVSYQWDINGDGSFGDKTTAEPTLTWDELRDFGLDDGLAEYQIALKVTNELGLDNEAFATVTINDTPPTVDVQIVDPAPTQPPLVGDLVRIESQARTSASTVPSAGQSTGMGAENSTSTPATPPQPRIVTTISAITKSKFG